MMDFSIEAGQIHIMANYYHYIIQNMNGVLDMAHPYFLFKTIKTFKVWRMTEVWYSTEVEADI
jgi:hypothetical protein